MRILTICLAIMLSTAALAQPKMPARGDNIVDPPLRPNEIDTIGCIFESWTLTGAGSATVRLIAHPGHADASPSAIVTAGPVVSGNTVTVRIAPDEGCGASGCRAGNDYQIDLQPVAGSDSPICTIRVPVRAQVLQ
jgi:hypothetical protein